MWPSISNASTGSDGLKGYNLILLDDDDCHVHAFIYADSWKSLADKIDEECVYVITNFYTKKAIGSLKPVSSPILINFSHSTTVEKVEEDDFMIPRHKFEFGDLGDLFGIATANTNTEYPEFSTDVIGVLEDYEGLAKIKTVHGDRNIVRFRLTDGRHPPRVTVWGPLAVATDTAYKACAARPIIIIMASVKMKTFLDYVQINTVPSTKIYLNLDNEVVSAMRQRLDEEGYVPSEKTLSSTSSAVLIPPPIIETITLKQLSEKTKYEFLKSMFLCKVKVKNIEESENWWYDCCHRSNCNEEVSKVEGKFRCFKCHRNYPIPQKRYRIAVLAEDETEAFSMVLLDRAVKRIVGKLIAERIDNQATLTDYPDELKAINGKDLSFKIELNEDNILLKSVVYIVTDAFDSEITASSKSEATNSDVEVTGFINNKDGDDVQNDRTTPDTAKYKFVVLAGDQTEALLFFLFSTASRRIIGQRATKLAFDNLQEDS
ncbi:replication factor A protein 1 [Daucus carota subsp. sativus]|uniref:replication factor A protein 1 n=1 Tax=Daucus carota subsp. sativus TaxID=79200 RepID=UPI00308314A5